MKEEVRVVAVEAIRDETAIMKARGYRLVTLTCVDLDPERFELLYHFDKDLKMTHLRTQAPKNAKVPSISPVYQAAFLVENEIQSLFGLMFEGLVIDYGQSLYLEGETVVTPFCKYQVAPSDGKEPADSKGNA